jgi:hypothetical protein
MEPNVQKQLLNLLESLRSAEGPYFNNKMILSAFESDPHLPGLLWSGGQSPRPSPRPYWRYFQNPVMYETAAQPEDALLWLGQMLSGQLGRPLALRILTAVVERDPDLLQELRDLPRFQEPPPSAQQQP